MTQVCKQGVAGSIPVTSTNLLNQLGTAAFPECGDCAQFCAPLPKETGWEIASTAVRFTISLIRKAGAETRCLVFDIPEGGSV